MKRIFSIILTLSAIIACGPVLDETGGADGSDTEIPGENPGGGDTENPDPDEPEINEGGNTNGYLVNYEIPHAEVDMEKGKAYSSIVKESFEGCKAFVYDTKNKEQKLVTHTYTYSGKVTRNYTMLYDKNKVCALWEAFPMHKTAYPDNNVGRAGSWKKNPAIPTDWQSVGCTNSYHKGHQVASNDRQACKPANYQTFYLTNQSPQWQTRFNDGIWNNLEFAINKSAPTGRDTLYVVTGPLFEKEQTTTDDGGQKVPLPSGFFKCVMKCSFNTSGVMTAAKGVGYIFENRAYSDKYYNYSCTIDAVETRTGFDLFANIPEELQVKAEATKGLQL